MIKKRFFGTEFIWFIMEVLGDIFILFSKSPFSVSSSGVENKGATGQYMPTFSTSPLTDFITNSF